MLSVQLPPEGAGRIACRVIHSVLAFHHRAAVQGFPCRWQAFGPVCSPVAGRGNAVCWFVALTVKERWCFAVAVCRCDGCKITAGFFAVNTGG